MVSITKVEELYIIFEFMVYKIVRYDLYNMYHIYGIILYVYCFDSFCDFIF